MTTCFGNTRNWVFCACFSWAFDEMCVLSSFPFAIEGKMLDLIL